MTNPGPYLPTPHRAASWINTVGILAALGGLVADASRGQEMPPVLVETSPVELREFPQRLTLVGRTRARSESRIVAEVTGRVRSIEAAEGRWVDRGAPLVTVDTRRLALSIEAKRAEEAQAEAQAVLAQKELERARELVETSVFPRRNLDSAVAEAARSEERHRQLQAERRQLELDLERSMIRAPFGGYTVKRLVEVGEWVAPGTPVYELVDLSVVEVTVDLPERHFGQVHLGSPAEVRVASGEEPLAGTVSGVAPDASETTHTFPVIVAVDNAQGRLAGGMLVRATLTLEGTFTSLAVSKDAIVRVGERTVVYAPVDGRAEAIDVTLAGTAASAVAIEANGLREGQLVIVRGNERLFPGSPVAVAGGPQQEDQP